MWLPMPSRRSFLQTSALASGSLVLGSAAAAQQTRPSREKREAPQRPAPGTNPVLSVALVGCGGRGLGAARQTLIADPDTKLVAMCDAFSEQVQSGLSTLGGIEEIADRIDAPEARQFVGLDCCERMLAEVPDVDIVLLCSPPFFRPPQLESVIEAGKHVFAEKPVATDIVGLKSVIETCRKAAEKKLSVVSGLCWRYETGMIETQRKIAEGLIGRPLHAQSVRYSGLVGRSQPGEYATEFERQLRNWYFYTWLSGDFIVEQFVHDLDQIAWAMGEYPTKCIATGGRETRPDEQGNIFDHFAALYTFPSGATYTATTRHQNGCTGLYYNQVTGTEGTVDLMRYTAETAGGERLFRGRRGVVPMHQAEHDRMYETLRRGERTDNSEYMIQSTLMGLLGRESAYTGRELSTEELLASNLSLQPSAIDWAADTPPADVAVPGVTTLTRGATPAAADAGNTPEAEQTETKQTEANDTNE